MYITNDQLSSFPWDELYTILVECVAADEGQREKFVEHAYIMLENVTTYWILPAIDEYCTAVLKSNKISHLPRHIAPFTIFWNCFNYCEYESYYGGFTFCNHCHHSRGETKAQERINQLWNRFVDRL
jgi:hypothetical protein